MRPALLGRTDIRAKPLRNLIRPGLPRKGRPTPDARMISRARVSWQRLDRSRTSSPQMGRFLNRARVGAPNFAQATVSARTRGSAGRLTHPPGARRPAVPQVRAPAGLALAFAPDAELPVPWPYGCFHEHGEASPAPRAGLV